jgi:hypothetical protein
MPARRSKKNQPFQKTISPGQLDFSVEIIHVANSIKFVSVNTTLPQRGRQPRVASLLAPH